MLSRRRHAPYVCITPLGIDDGHLAYRLGLGDGTFAPTQSLGLGSGLTPMALVVRDLDGDGAVDVACANAVTADVTVWSGLGGGAFSAPASYALGASGRGLEAGDVDGDGRIDLVAPTFGGAGGAIVVLRGQPGGGFAAPIVVATGWLATSLAVGDFDGDGQDDVAAARLTADAVHLFRSSGGGALFADGSSSTSSRPTSASRCCWRPARGPSRPPSRWRPRSRRSA